MNLNRAGRRQQSKEDLKRLARGIDPDSQDPEPVAALARHLLALFEKARHEKNIDPPVRFLQAKVEATLQGLRNIRVACGKGCDHCCHVWVSATAPEILYIAKLIQRQASPGARDRVAAAHAFTGAFDSRERARHPHPCPMLSDQVCSIYAARPLSCRFAVSADATACSRTFRELIQDTIPTPLSHLRGRGAFEVAVTIALNRAGLPHHYYEFNAALSCALARSDCESAWLCGEDIFALVRRDPHDILGQRTTQMIARQAFARSQAPE